MDENFTNNLDRNKENDVNEINLHSVGRKQHIDEKRKNKRQEKKHKAKASKKALSKAILMLTIRLFVIALMFYIMFFHIVGLTRIKDIAMKPTIAAGDLLLYNRIDKEYHVGDVVTFEKDGKRYVLRIIALEEQTVSLNGNNDFITNGGSEQPEIYFENIIPEDSGITYPYTVEKGKVFVVGDYRAIANDSRKFGAIDISIIDGKVIGLLQTKDI